MQASNRVPFFICLLLSTTITPCLAQNWHETVLNSFNIIDGSEPISGVIRDKAGNLYGSTVLGGANSCDGTTQCIGTVFKLDASGQETVLHKFTGSGGAFPESGVTLDSAGNLYGTTLNDSADGGAGLGGGIVYKIDASGQATVLYKFCALSLCADGSNPLAALTLDSAGNLYGTTETGGANGHGVVYKLDPAGHETVLHSFTGGSDGADPAAGVMFHKGNLYGTTFGGGQPGNCGVVYKLNSAGNETVLYTFTCGVDGYGPASSLVFDSAGNLYGTTSYGGDGSCFIHRGPSGCGVVYKLAASGQFTLLHTFEITGADAEKGYYPSSGVILDSAGNLYGTTSEGGPAYGGLVYKLNPAGNETVLYNFCSLNNCADGAHPAGGVTPDSSGNFYGVTSSGGASCQCGVVFKLEAPGK
jgi:uncharacterized repeat protein (TIGR03803 family)